MTEKTSHDSQEWLNVTCPVCGKRFHLKPYKVKIDKNHYCSLECHRLAKMEYMSGEKNHQYGLRGEKNASWRGGKRKTVYGYILVQSLGHPFAWNGNDYVFEHRLIAEKYLLTEENSVVIDGKRYLSPDYIVHHKNGIRTDNRPENLEIMLPGKHQSQHSSEYEKYRSRNSLGQYISESPKEVKAIVEKGLRT